MRKREGEEDEGKRILFGARRFPDHQLNRPRPKFCQERMSVEYSGFVFVRVRL